MYVCVCEWYSAFCMHARTHGAFVCARKHVFCVNVDRIRILLKTSSSSCPIVQTEVSLCPSPSLFISLPVSLTLSLVCLPACMPVLQLFLSVTNCLCKIGVRSVRGSRCDTRDNCLNFVVVKCVWGGSYACSRHLWITPAFSACISVSSVRSSPYKAYLPGWRD